jgi:hypothetical protein
LGKGFVSLVMFLAWSSDWCFPPLLLAVSWRVAC